MTPAGHYTGTVFGVLLIVLLQSMLSVLQMPEAGRQIIYGGVLLVCFSFTVGALAFVNKKEGRSGFQVNR